MLPHVVALGGGQHERLCATCAENAPPGVAPWHVDLTDTCGERTAQLRDRALTLMGATPLEQLPEALLACEESAVLTSAGAL